MLELELGLELELEVTAEEGDIDEDTVKVEIDEAAELVTEVIVENTEMGELKNRTSQLFELIAFDPNNTQIYRNEIIELNIRLVPHVLKKYKPFGDDEFQMGCIGLIVATNSFDPARGVPYASYACFCIARELHKAHNHHQHQFEGAMGEGLTSLDEYSVVDGEMFNRHENIADEVSEADFEKLLQDFSLDGLFDKIIMPSIEGISKATKGQDSTVDFDHWKALEMQYLIELAEIDSQKSRLSLTSMAKKLGVSTQNIRMRHKRVIQQIRQRCVKAGYAIS